VSREERWGRTRRREVRIVLESQGFEADSDGLAEFLGSGSVHGQAAAPQPKDRGAVAQLPVAGHSSTVRTVSAVHVQVAISPSLVATTSRWTRVRPPSRSVIAGSRNRVSAVPLPGMMVIGSVDAVTRDSLSDPAKVVWAVVLVLTVGVAGLVYFPWMYSRTKAQQSRGVPAPPPGVGAVMQKRTSHTFPCCIRPIAPCQMFWAV